MKKEHISAAAILIRKKLGETISNQECEMVNSLLNNDSEFKSLANKLLDEDYLLNLSEYNETNAEERIKSNIAKRISEIKKRRARRRLNITVTSIAAAVITIIITLGLQFVDKRPNPSLLSNFTQTSIDDSYEDVTLITENGKNVKLTGAIYYAGEKETSKDTVKRVETRQITMSTIVVPLTKDFNIILSDGTKVWLNSGSKLIFPDEFQENERVVEIDGEGYFEVTPDAKKPFIVRNLVMDTKVLGTKFLVSAYSTDYSRSISLVEGKVEVTSLISDFSSKLVQGKGVVFDVNKYTFKNVEVNINNVLLKVNGMLVFENESLEAICNALVRKYGISYSIKSEKLKTRQFYIKTKKYDSIETVMELLKAAGDINYKIEENHLTIY